MEVNVQIEVRDTQSSDEAVRRGWIVGDPTPGELRRVAERLAAEAIDQLAPAAESTPDE